MVHTNRLVQKHRMVQSDMLIQGKAHRPYCHSPIFALGLELPRSAGPERAGYLKTKWGLIHSSKCHVRGQRAQEQ